MTNTNNNAATNNTVAEAATAATHAAKARYRAAEAANRPADWKLLRLAIDIAEVREAAAWAAV